MPTYKYDPVSKEEGEEGLGFAQGGSTARKSSDVLDEQDPFTKKRDLCVGFLVLAAIVYVLARASSVGKGCDYAMDSGVSEVENFGRCLYWKREDVMRPVVCLGG